ncbi:MAG: DUF427 domain-containing protein [Solirubrobacteraceae bacterium]
MHLPNSNPSEFDVKAIWNGATLAESDDTVVVEDNHYFPADSINAEYFTDSDTHSVCPWKGTASYKTIEVDGEQNADAAWFYPEPKDAAAEIKDRFAFWKGVRVEA